MQVEQKDIFELLHRRRKKSSTIFCSQYGFEEWYDQLGGDASPLADAIIDRIAHDSYRVNITSIDVEHDISMREVYGLDKVLPHRNIQFTLALEFTFSSQQTLVLGIDVGSETHYARAFDYRGIEYSKKPFKFSNTEVGFVTFKEWILDLKEKHEKDKVVPGMEPTGHYWFNLGKFLQDNEMKPVLVNPHHVKKSKELDDNNPTDM